MFYDGAETGSTCVVKEELSSGMISAVFGSIFINANDNFAKVETEAYAA